MCESKEFKHLPHLSLALLTICLILICITISCVEDGLIWVYSEHCIYWPSQGSWDCHDITTSYGWQKLQFDYSWFSHECDSSGSALATVSILSLCVIISVIATIGYFRVCKKIEYKIFSPCYERIVFLIICAILLIVLIATSVAYYVECRDDIDSVFLDVIHDWGPDYGLFVLWVACLILLVLVVLNSGVYRWSGERTSREADNAPDTRQYDHVPTHEQAAAPQQTEPVKTAYVQTSTEQTALKQEGEVPSADKKPPPPFNPDVLMVVNQSDDGPSDIR